LSVVGRAPGIVPLSHWGTVRREGNGRRRNERIIQCLRDILWKTCAKSSALWREYDAIVEAGPGLSHRRLGKRRGNAARPDHKLAIEANCTRRADEWQAAGPHGNTLPQ
jgi:hypothetical protein